jgi:hypothetical protein
LSRLERAQIHSVTCVSAVLFNFHPVALLWHYQEVKELRKMCSSHVHTDIWSGNIDKNQTYISRLKASEILGRKTKLGEYKLKK